MSSHLGGVRVVSHVYDFWMHGVTGGSDANQTKHEIQVAVDRYINEKISTITCKSLGCILGLTVAKHTDWKRLYLFGVPTDFNIDTLLGELNLKNREIFIFTNYSDTVSNVSVLQKLEKKYPSVYFEFFENDFGHNYDQVEQYFPSKL